jgi:hypothetical protein
MIFCKDFLERKLNINNFYLKYIKLIIFFRKYTFDYEFYLILFYLKNKFFLKHIKLKVFF